MWLAGFLSAMLWMAQGLPPVLPGWLAQDEKYREREVLDPDKDEWREQAPEPPGTPAGDLELARSHLARGEPRKARKLLKQWLAANPDQERYAEAMFLSGESYFEMKDFYKAYEQYEYVVENASGELFQKGVRKEMDVARAFLAGQKRIVWKILRLPAYDDGVEILGRVWERMPGTRLGEEALRLKADYYFNSGDVDLAQDQYALLAREYPNGRYTALAMLRSAVAAQAAFPGVKFTDGALLNAEERYRQFQKAFPQYAEREKVDERLEGIRQQRADKDLDIAKWYERTSQKGAAAYYYRLVLKDWPNTLAAGEAARRLRGLGFEAESPQENPQP